jgi:hypothetical protein
VVPTTFYVSQRWFPKRAATSAPAPESGVASSEEAR